mgnify:CR=1
MPAIAPMGRSYSSVGRITWNRLSAAHLGCG